jgi:hypothetical protein
MPNLINMPSFTEDGDVYVVVETPRGSRVCCPHRRLLDVARSSWIIFEMGEGTRP